MKADMNQDDDIRSAQARVADIFTKKPRAAFSTVSASAHVGEGLLCKARQGDYEAMMDMGAILGGEGKAPTPGFYFRAAVTGCIAIGIKMAAAREGIHLDAVDVHADMDFDDSALIGMGQNSAAPLETRLTIKLTSNSPAEQLVQLVDRALACDPFFLALRDAQKVKTQVMTGVT
jgi:uncharacterized OsmC-like protein